MVESKPSPHFLRFARSVVFAASALSAGCAAAVTPDDGGDAEIADTSPSSDVPTADPCRSPGPTNAPCDVPGTMCGGSCGAWRCTPPSPGSGAHWIQLFCGGPCRPPEVAAAA
jgi:hypothetical protein